MNSFLFYDEETLQGKALQINPWIVNTRYTTPPAKTIYQVIQGKLLMGIELMMSKSTAHPVCPIN